MATLTAADYRDIRKSCYAKGAGKEELKALSSLPNEATLLSVFQAAEGRTVAAFLLFRADMESLLGIPQNAASLALAKKLYVAYLLWKISHV